MPEKKPKARFKLLYGLLATILGVCLGCWVLLTIVAGGGDEEAAVAQRQATVEQVATPAPEPSVTPEPSATPAPTTPPPSPTPEAVTDDAAIQAEAGAVLAELERYLEAGRQMEPLRVTDDTDKMQACGQQMRGNQDELEILRDRAGELPLEYLLLSSAAANLNRCVSCTPDALEYCDLAEADLNEFKEISQ